MDTRLRCCRDAEEEVAPASSSQEGTRDARQSQSRAKAFVCTLSPTSHPHHPHSRSYFPHPLLSAPERDPLHTTLLRCRHSCASSKPAAVRTRDRSPCCTNDRLKHHMSIWQQYSALADYISLKYQSELHIVLGTATTLIEEELETRSIRSGKAFQSQHKHFYRQLQRTLHATRAAPSASTYERSAHGIRLTPKIVRRVTKPRHCPKILRLPRGPPRSSLFAQKAELRKWQTDLLQRDLSSPELAFFLV